MLHQRIATDWATDNVTPLLHQSIATDWAIFAGQSEKSYNAQFVLWVR